MNLYTYKVRRVHRIVDGDTYDLELDLGFYQFAVMRFRLLGVDTPEMYGKNTSPAGTEARDFVIAWFDKYLVKGNTVIAHTEKSDSFGRWLVDIECWGLSDEGYVTVHDLAEDLVEAGLATVYEG